MNYNDQYFLLADFESYIRAQKRVSKLYKKISLGKNLFD